jgi:hypothetical protein
VKRAALLLLLVGCGDDGQAPGTGGTGGIGGIGGAAGTGGMGGTGGMFADVSGTSIVNVVSDRGEMPLPTDLTAGAPNALVGTQTIAGTGDVSGHFTVPEVPDGALVQFGETYVQLGSGRVLDFGYDQLGRADAAYPTMSGTQLHLQMTGLLPWAIDDDLELISSNSGAYGFLVGGAQNPPAPTATTLNMTVDWLNLDGNNALIDSTKGDTVILVQMVHASSSTHLDYTTASKNFVASDLHQTDGQTADILGSFADSTGAGQVTIDWRRSGFEALKTSVHPNAVSLFQGLYIDVQPGGLSHGVFSGTVDVIAAQPPLDSSDLNYGTVSYHNPYPSAWGWFGWVLHEFKVDYMLAGTSTPTTIATQISWQADVPTFTAGPVVPVIAPPSAPKVNDQDARAALSGVGTTPTLSWDAPASGTASNYSIIVYALTASGNQTTHQIVARLYTSGSSTRLRLPPGLLTMEKSYVFEVQAFAMPGVNLVERPFRVSLPMGFAGTLTALVTP